MKSTKPKIFSVLQYNILRRTVLVIMYAYDTYCTVCTVHTLYSTYIYTYIYTFNNTGIKYVTKYTVHLNKVNCMAVSLLISWKNKKKNRPTFSFEKLRKI